MLAASDGVKERRFSGFGMPDFVEDFTGRGIPLDAVVVDEDFDKPVVVLVDGFGTAQLTSERDCDCD